MPAQENVWKRFYDRTRLDERCDWSQWKAIIDLSGCNPFPWATKLFALARYEALEAKNEDPLMRQNFERIAHDKFGFQYGDEFKPEHAEKIRDDLSHFGVELPHAGNGDQYLRTIRRLSGAVYLKAAKAINNNKLPIEKWFDAEGKLAKSIAVTLKPYDTEDTLFDVAAFFRGVKEHFERFNKLPTAEECFQDENILTLEMLRRILDALVRDGNANTPPRRVSDTRPVLGLVLRLDEKWDPVVKFPGEPTFDVGGAAKLVCFDFIGTDYRACFRRKPDGSGWQMERDVAVESGVPIECVAEIVRTVWDSNWQQIGDKLDVTPDVLRDTSVDHVLFRLGVSGQGEAQALGPGEMLSSNGGDRYFAAPLHSAVPTAAILRNGEEKVISATEKTFTISADADALRIGETVYPVKTKVAEWLDPYCCRWTGARLFCEESESPFSLKFLSEKDVQALYRKQDGSEISLSVRDASGIWSLQNLGEVVRDILWDSGWIVFRQKDQETKRALTFIPKVDDHELAGPFPLDEERYVSIHFGEPPVLVHVPALARKITLPAEKVHGFPGFSFKIKRSGASFHAPGMDADIPLSTDERNPTPIARDDFAVGTFEINPAGLSASKVDIQVNGQLMSLKQIKSLGAQLLAKMSASDVWSIFIDDENKTEVRLRLYDPEKTPVRDNSKHPVSWEREGDDLLVRFWIAHCWSKRPLGFLFYPAHKQDQGPKMWNKVEMGFDLQEDGRLIASMRVKGLYSDPTVEWGWGLLAFAAFRENDHYHAVSSGFFVAAENPDSFQLSDDPCGLRKAMAMRDAKAIDGIMQRDDEDARHWVRDFESKTLVSLDRVRQLDAFHAYRSHHVGADGKEIPSGYFFMAGWLLLEKMKKFARRNLECGKEQPLTGNPEMNVALLLLQYCRNGVLPPDYKGKWTPLLIADRFFVPEAFFSPDGARGMPRNAILQYRKDIATQALGVWDEVVPKDDVSQINWTSCAAFQGNEHAIQRLIDLLIKTRNIFPRSRDPDASEGNASSAGQFQGAFFIGNMRKADAQELENCIDCLAQEVAKWRKNPTLEGAQALRDLLLEVQSIDGELHRAFHGEGGPKHTMLERIAFKADYLLHPEADIPPSLPTT